jgi:hypothetical protein
MQARQPEIEAAALAGEIAAMAVRDEPDDLSALAFNDGEQARPDAWRISAARRAGQPVGDVVRALPRGNAGVGPSCRRKGRRRFQGRRDQSVDTGDDAKPKAFLDEIGVSNLGLYRDASMGVFNTLKKEGLAFGLPVTLMIGKDGCMLGAMNGPAEWAGEDAKALTGALKGT